MAQIKDGFFNHKYWPNNFWASNYWPGKIAGFILTTFAETFKAIAAALGFRAEPQITSFRAKGENLIFKAMK
jgi:hypothetical protein